MQDFDKNPGWEQANMQVFWGEMAPCDHFIQIYENHDDFLSLLEIFVSEGLKAGDGVIVLASPNHLESLDERLRARGADLDFLIENNQYLPYDAEKLLDKFMVNGWPNEKLFIKEISKILKKAGSNNKKVRAFGEMVAVLWAKGQCGATLRIEHLWNELCLQESFCLFCAYPQTGFTQDAIDSVMHICNAHNKIISGRQNSKTDIFFKNSHNKS